MYQSLRISLVHLGNALMMLGSHRESAHIRVDIDGLHQAIDGALHIHLLVAVRGIHIAGSSIVATSGPSV